MLLVSIIILVLLLAYTPIWYARKKEYPINLSQLIFTRWLGLVWFLIGLHKLVTTQRPMMLETPFSWEFLTALGLAMGPVMVLLDWRFRYLSNLYFRIKRDISSHYVVKIENINLEYRRIDFSMRNGHKYRGRYEKINGKYRIIDESVAQITKTPNWQNS